MNNSDYIFNLKVQKIDQICLFELTWGKGQRLNTQINYPPVLTQLYQDWRRAYLNFYRSENMRGRTVDGGVAKLTVDLHAEIVKAESKFMYEFHRWLRSAELYEIRAQIAQTSQQFSKDNPDTNIAIQIFLTCAPLELDRFPWEAWELGNEFATNEAIQIIRTPLNISTESQDKRQGKPRILAILGDDTGLNFKAEKEALKSLMRIADVEFVGWQPQYTAAQVIQEITEAIADDRGWDVLFFAGHSNETELTGGELGIAPDVSISIKEIAPHLSAAKKRGLQVAIFNSCSGLSIADALIDLGFGQVVVMREPIHNSVAQGFMVRFLQGLAKHLDVYESLTEARQFLRMDKSHTYPSSYLVPSLFCHPGAELYRIPAFRWQQRLRQSIPNRLEAIALALSLSLGFLVPVQELLLEARVLTQSVYRNVTAQIPTEQAPPVALVQIDNQSLYRAQMPSNQLLPMNRSYISKLIDGTRKLKASVVGLDFIFDTPQKDPASGDTDLKAAVHQAVDANMWLMFAASLEPDREVGVNEALEINKWDWTLQGYIDAYPNFVEMPDAKQDCRKTCPFAYLLSLVYLAKDEIEGFPQPNTNRQQNLRAEVLDIVQKHNKPGNLSALSQWRSPFGLQPILDYSIPPKQVYQTIPAWQLIEQPDINKFPLMSKQVVLIAVGSDERLGIAAGKPDFSPAPAAIGYWTQQKQAWLTGGETLAYMVHHFLTKRLVIPIPDIWMIGIAIILGKITVFIIKNQSRLSLSRRRQIMAGSIGAVTLYGIGGLQLYISGAILLPWFLPSAVFLAYVLPATRRNNHA
ncbi:CHASE2 domain-containing protein [Calothrix sp. FACHB-1219]|uniref:CHASE2 domain-containing protein n=1 Tax=unclassified Calothrix TaxID=2619626 RepID=UPI00168353E1|nr:MULTISPECIES: CHASE2 domain-containing protein [unclassified Calothrix]MBD2204535.1 CHASE2 domain-containing protein [Calothrix sp. FACHB-168]MBD2219333.1 CHASE2 domain-containing protein [Calothrix sp. FACHB-1219]